jgi:transposase
MSIVAQPRARITLGIDTHRDINVAAGLDERGTHLGTAEFSTTADGHLKLWAWANDLGDVANAGVEGCNSYGAGIARFLQAQGVSVIEVRRPNRQSRRQQGKSDPLDALAAARCVQSNEVTTIAKTGRGPVEAIRILRVARRSAREQRVAALNQMRALVVTAPDELRAQFERTTIFQLLETAARLRPGRDLGEPAAATKHALRSLARRVIGLDAELSDLDKHLVTLTTKSAPDLLTATGVGPDTASALLAAAGDNPDRMHSEAAFARLCGVAPIPASTGPRTRYRLHRGGDRQANQALWRITMVRLTCDPDTQAYMRRRIEQGKTKREAIRCIKRYIAREIYGLLPTNLKPAPTP